MRFQVEMAGIEYHPLVGTPSEIKTRLERRALYGGDGGNRTRVRKTRPTEIYERSRLSLSSQAPQPAKRPATSRLGPKTLFRAVSDIMRGTHPFVTPSPITGGSTGRVDAASSRRPADPLIAYAARGIAA